MSSGAKMLQFHFQPWTILSVSIFKCGKYLQGLTSCYRKERAAALPGQFHVLMDAIIHNTGFHLHPVALLATAYFSEDRWWRESCCILLLFWGNSVYYLLGYRRITSCCALQGELCQPARVIKCIVMSFLVLVVCRVYESCRVCSGATVNPQRSVWTRWWWKHSKHGQCLWAWSMIMAKKSWRLMLSPRQVAMTYFKIFYQEGQQWNSKHSFHKIRIMIRQAA